MIVQQNRKLPSTVLTAHNGTGNRTFMCNRSMSTMCFSFSCKTGLKIGHEVKVSEINLKVNYVDKQNSGKYSVT